MTWRHSDCGQLMSAARKCYGQKRNVHSVDSKGSPLGTELSTVHLKLSQLVGSPYLNDAMRTIKR